jgi:hypothetical protein
MCLTADGRPATRVRVTQNGFEESPRWRRYRDVARAEWERLLEALKHVLETPR